jgi:hypothetical protein
MGFFDDYNEEEVRPRRKSRRGIGDSDRLDWQDMVEEIDDPMGPINGPDEEPDEELEEDEDTIQELEIDDHGRMRRSSRDEIDPDFWNEDE